MFDLSLHMEKTDVKEDDVEFAEPCIQLYIPFSLDSRLMRTPDPSVAREITPAEVTPSNILFVTVENFAEPFDAPLLIVTTADRALRLYSATGSHALQRSYTTLSDSPILSVAVYAGKYLFLTCMSGRVITASASTGDIISSVTHHTKYATRVLLSAPYVVTSSYDKSILLYSLSGDLPVLGDPIGKLTPASPPEALAIVALPSTGEKALVYSRRDSTLLHYHLLQPSMPPHSTRNLAPDSNSWVHFHAMSLAVHPCNPALLAVATSAVPHMKFMLVRVDADEVLKEVFTAAPQSAYSTAVVVWRSDAAGVWVNADDGVVRGIDVKYGKVRARLTATARMEKVRTLWAGVVAGEEVVVTGAFDKGLKIWRVQEEKEDKKLEAAEATADVHP